MKAIFVEVFVLLVISQSIALHWTNSDYFDSLKCLLKLYRKYLGSENIYPGSIVKVKIMKTQWNFHNSFLKQLFYDEFQLHNSTIMIESNTSTKTDLERWKKTNKYILIAENANEVNQTIQLWKLSTSWNPFAPVLVIFCGKQSLIDVEINVKIIFGIFLHHEMLQSHLIQINAQQGYAEIFDWQSNTTEICLRKIESIKSLEKCHFNDNMNSSSIKLSPYMNTDVLKHCPLRISASIYPPLVFYVDQHANGLWSGAEIFVIKILAKKLNVSIEITANFIERNGQRINGIRGIDQPIFNGYVCGNRN